MTLNRKQFGGTQDDEGAEPDEPTRSTCPECGAPLVSHFMEIGKCANGHHNRIPAWSGPSADRDDDEQR